MSTAVKDTKMCTARLPISWVNALNERVTNRGTSFSAEVRIALSEYLEREGISI